MPAIGACIGFVYSEWNADFCVNDPYLHQHKCTFSNESEKKEIFFSKMNESQECTENFHQMFQQIKLYEN